VKVFATIIFLFILFYMCGWLSVAEENRRETANQVFVEKPNRDK